MDLQFVTSRSSQTPELLDKTSSQTVTYIRRNVKEIQEKDPFTEETRTMFEYEECALPKDQYALYVLETALENADTDAQVALAEISELVTSTNTNVELALAEISELIAAAHQG